MTEEDLWVKNAKRILLSDKHSGDFIHWAITTPLESNPQFLNSWEQIRPAFLEALEVECVPLARFLVSLTDRFSCFAGWVPDNLIRPTIEYFNNVIDTKQYRYWKHAVRTIHNLSLTESAREEIRKCGAVDKLLFMRADEGNNQKWWFKETITAALAILLGHIENNKQLTVDDSMISAIIKTVNNRRVVSRAQSKHNRCFLWERLVGLASLVRADQNKKVIAKYYKEIFACVTGEDNAEDYMADERTRNLIWQIIEQLSFLEQIQRAIHSDDIIMANLKKFHKIDKTCAGILWNIRNCSKEGIKINSLNDEVKNEEKAEHIMISYNWKYQDLAKKLAKYLKDRNHKVWMDIEHMSGSTLEAMADAIERSSIVLILFSDAYKNSANCRREGEYVASLKKPFIPVLSANGYRADGWLGILLGTKLWINLSTDKNFKQNVQKLEKEISIQMNSKTKQNKQNNSSAKNQIAVSAQDSEILSFPSRFAKPPEVQRWLRKVGVADSVVEASINLGLDGAWLYYYQKVAKSSSVNEFGRISREFFPELSLVDLFKLGGWMIE